MFGLQSTLAGEDFGNDGLCTEAGHGILLAKLSFLAQHLQQLLWPAGKLLHAGPELPVVKSARTHVDDIAESLGFRVDADLPNMNGPADQSLSLVRKDVLVENVQAVAGAGSRPTRA